MEILKTIWIRLKRLKNWLEVMAMASHVARSGERDMAKDMIHKHQKREK